MAVTPIDGRYHARTRALAAYFSEFALIRYRVRVEIEWLIALAENPALEGIHARPRRGAAAARVVRRFHARPTRAGSRSSSARPTMTSRRSNIS